MIRIVTALIRSAQGHVLLVGKRGTDSFMQPGGKREPGGKALAPLTRDTILPLALLPEDQAL